MAIKQAPFVWGTGPAGQVAVDSRVDENFRKELLRLAPDSIRRKIDFALRYGPNPDRRHALRYFGDDAPKIVAMATPLVDAIQDHFEYRLGMPGFAQWLRITGYGDDYRMIKAFLAWAEMKKPETVN